LDWRSAVIETAWRCPLLWRGLTAMHPRYTAARCRLRRRPRLRWVGFEVTNRCNLSCVMCSSVLTRRRRGLMPREVFLSRIAEIPDGSLHHIALHAVGEPLLHPDIALFARLARPKTGELFLSTNGLLFDRDTALMRRLLDAGLTHVHFSAEGFDPATYEAVRVGGRFADFYDNLRLFRRVRDECGSRASVDLQYTLFRPPDLAEIQRVLVVYGPIVDAVHFKPLNNQSHDAVPYRPGESIHGLRCYGDEPLPCLAMWCGCTVLRDGSVSLCPRDHSAAVVAGEPDMPLAAAWSGERARSLRRAHVRRAVPEVCGACSEPHARTLRVLELDRRLNALAAGGVG
jgi:uncharacterized Fe-S cluster-containing radical SAM superfamily protein